MALVQAMADRFNPTAGVTQIQRPWPPSSMDKARMEGYRTNRLIFDGLHVEAFGDRDELERYNVYIACNIGALIVKASTDILFGEDLDFEFDKGVSDERKQVVLDLWRDANLQQKLYESALDAATFGDSILEVSRDEDVVSIDALPVETWYPSLNPDNVREIDKHTFAWKRSVKDSRGKDTEFIRMRIHERGLITNELWLLENSKLVRAFGPDSDVWQTLMSGVEETEDTGLDDFAVRHIPNYRVSREYFGRSEFQGLHSLFSALNARLTQYDYVLTNHAEPIIKGPEGIPNEDGTVDRNNLEYMIVDDKESDTLEYLTYDGKLDDSSRIIKELTDKILLLSETDKAAIGLAEGGGPVSGRALRFSMFRTLNKVNRRRRYYDQVIPDLLEIAQRMRGIGDPVRPSVQWPDGLPNDRNELLEELSQRLLDGAIGRRRYVERLDGVDPDTAQEIVDEAEEDAQTETSAVAQALGTSRPAIPRPEISLTAEEV